MDFRAVVVAVAVADAVGCNKFFSITDTSLHMKIHKPARFGIAALSFAVVALAPAIASAQTQQAPLQSDKWQYSATIYGYLPTIGGSTTFPGLPGSPSPSLGIDTKTIIDHLKMTFMGSLEIHNGKWGLWNDVMYLDLGDSKNGVRDFTIDGVPTHVSANVSLDIKSTVWTVAGEYRLATSDPAWTVDLLAGARMLKIQNTLGYSFSGSVGQDSLAGRSGSIVVSETLWDGIVGFKGNYAFGTNREWFAPYYLDVGTGQSQSTWQAAAGIGYKFGGGELTGMWRYLDYSMKSGTALQSVNLNGPLVAATFRW